MHHFKQYKKITSFDLTECIRDEEFEIFLWTQWITLAQIRPFED